MKPRMVLTASLVLVAATLSRANLSLVMPIGGNAVPQAVGDGGRDTVDLNPFPVAYLPVRGEAVRRVIGQLASEFPAPSGAGATGWFFGAGAALNGTLNIDVYKARTDDGGFPTHVGGAEFRARYVRAEADPAPTNLRWVQLVDTSNPLSGAGNPRIDGPPTSLGADDRPFYWNEAAVNIPGSNPPAPTPGITHNDHSFGANGFGAFDLEFIDLPKRACKDHEGTTINWRADLFLTSYEPGVGGRVNTVAVHDGIRWGFDFTCVPEPATVAFLVLGVLLTSVKRRKALAA